MSQYLVFSSGQTNTNVIFTGNTLPTDNVHTYIPWQLVNGDNDPNNYTLVDGSLTYTPPPSPNPQAFAAALMQDSTISSTTKANLAAYFAVLESYDAETAPLVQATWQNLIATYGSTWLDSNTVTLIQNYAAEYNMPLV